MAPAELPFTSEEELLADRFVREAGLVVECPRHAGEFHRACSRLETIRRIDLALAGTPHAALALIRRSDVLRKALVMIRLRDYPDVCPQCSSH